MTKTTKFAWAMVGEGNYEPVAITGKKGERLAYTIGCPDPFPVDVEGSAVALHEDEILEAPMTPKQEAAAERRERRFRAMQSTHGYAGFGR